jgi:hypothetical protein
MQPLTRAARRSLSHGVFPTLFLNCLRQPDSRATSIHQTSIVRIETLRQTGMQGLFLFIVENRTQRNAMLVEKKDTKRLQMMKVVEKLTIPFPS